MNFDLGFDLVECIGKSIEAPQRLGAFAVVPRCEELVHAIRVIDLGEDIQGSVALLLSIGRPGFEVLAPGDVQGRTVRGNNRYICSPGACQRLAQRGFAYALELGELVDHRRPCRIVCQLQAYMHQFGCGPG